MISESLYRSLAAKKYFRGRDRLLSLVKVFIRPGWRLINDRCEMFLDPAEWLQLELIINRCTEPATTGLIRRLLHPGDIVVDVGAHVGVFTLFSASAVSPDGLVIAIEPQPENVYQLTRNLQRNDFTHVVVVEGAAGSKDEYIELPVQSESDRSRLSLLAPGINDQTDKFSARCYRLDTLLSDHLVDRVRLLKIDVEGYELEVLAGAADCLRKTENIILEILPDLGEARLQKTLDLLSDNGFALYAVTGKDYVTGGSLVENNLWAKRLE